MVKLLFFFLIIMMQAACTMNSPNSIEGYSNDINQQFNLKQYDNSDLKNEDFKTEVEFIYLILKGTPELNTHRMNGEIENKIFVTKDGREAVYDKNGNLVTNCENQGSYNYAIYDIDPLAHFTVDSLPWLSWGNCKEDRTTIEQRLKAYIEDLKIGFSKLLEVNEQRALPDNFDITQPGQSQAISFFKNSLEYSDFDLVEFASSKKTNSHAKNVKFFEAVEKGFLSLLR